MSRGLPQDNVKKFLWIAAAALLLTGLIFLMDQREPIDEAPANVLRIGTTMRQNSFSIDSQQGAFGRMNYNSFVQPMFVEIDENGRLQPGFMRSWEVRDGCEIIFTYPADVYWHDGQPVTDEDILYTFEHLRRKRTTTSRLIETVELLPEHRLRILLKEPQAYYFLMALCPYLSVYPKHIWDKVEVPSQYRAPDAAVGCGPYQFVRYDPVAQISYYTAVSDYFHGEISIPAVEIHTFGTQEAMLAALKNGQIDAVYDYSHPIRPTIIDWGKSPVVDPGESDNIGCYYLAFGYYRDATWLLPIRRAIACAIDYDLLARTIAGDYGQVPSAGLISPGNVGFDPNLPHLHRDLTKAAAILDEANICDRDGDGIREMVQGENLCLMITLSHSASEDMVYLRIAEVLQKNLREIGIDSVIDDAALRSQASWQRHLLDVRDYELYVGYISPGVAQYYTACYHLMPKEFHFNWGTFAEPEYTEAYLHVLNAANEADYMDAVRTMQQMNAIWVPAVSLCWERAFYPYRTDRFEGWINYPSWGVINNKTWYQTRLKSASEEATEQR